MILPLHAEKSECDPPGTGQQVAWQVERQQSDG